MGKRRTWHVLITGCSTGIGRALAAEFIKQGHQVTATARRVETLADLAAQGALVDTLDVTDQDSIEAAVSNALDRCGHIDMLINNAGFGLMGPLLEVGLDDFRRQLDTNVTGQLAVAQALAPHMIKLGYGRIVNVGSVSGLLTTPFAGAYCASKAALHAVSDALRMELAPFGIEVITLQSGGVASSFGDTAAQWLEKGITEDSLYYPIKRYMEGRAKAGQEKAMQASDFAHRVAAAVTAEQPPALLRLGEKSTIMPLYKIVVPIRGLDRFLRKKFGLEKLKRPS